MEQRTIKFKAKCLDNREWVEGYYIKKPSYHQTPKGDVVEDGEEHLIFGMTKDDVQPLCYEVDPSTVCQFTGLKDKSLTPIYEGDIIQNPEWPFEKRIVTWVKHQACYMPMDEEGCQDRDFSFLVLFKEWTVVGNKFDRKEEK